MNHSRAGHDDATLRHRHATLVPPLLVGDLLGSRMKIAVAAGVAARRQTATKRAICSVAGIRSGVAV